MNKILIFITLILPLELWSQTNDTLFFVDCMKMSIENMQINKTDSLNSQIIGLQKQNIKSTYFPKITLNGQATYQSDALSLDIPIPGLTIPEMPLDQYKAYIELNQILYDGGMTKATAQMLDLNLQMSNIQSQIREIEIKKAVSDIFSLVVLMDKQLEIINTQLGNLYEQQKIVESSVKNELLPPVNRDILEAEILKVEQKKTEIQETRTAAIYTLSQYTGKNYSETTKFVIDNYINLSDTMTSPQLKIIDIQKQQTVISDKQLSAGRKPKLFLFAQGGYGRPGLNMLSDEFSPYFIGGVKLSWNLYDWNNTSRNRQINMIKQDELEIQHQNTLITINAKKANILAKVNTTEKQIEIDKRIIELNEKIMKTYESQLKNGIITTSDYIIQLNKLSQAKIQLELHKIQLKQLKYDYTLVY